MIGWTRLVAATACVISASLGCAAATPRASAPGYFRSPPLDYVDAPRSASDGEALGAHQHPPDDWLVGNASSQHGAPGWTTEYGRPRFQREAAAGGHGVLLEAPACNPASSGPLPPEEARLEAAQRRAWLSGVHPPPLPLLASAVADMAYEDSRFLTCAAP